MRVVPKGLSWRDVTEERPQSSPGFSQPAGVWIFNGRKLERDVSPPFAESSAIFRRRPAQKKMPTKAI